MRKSTLNKFCRFFPNNLNLSNVVYNLLICCIFTKTSNLTLSKPCSVLKFSNFFLIFFPKILKKNISYFPAVTTDDGSATPTIILLPFGRMLVVDRSIFAQLQTDHSGIDFMELSANIIRNHQRLQFGSTPSFLDSEATSKGLSPTSLGLSPPSYEEIFGEKPSDLPPSYSEVSLMFRQFRRTLNRSSESVLSTDGSVVARGQKVNYQNVCVLREARSSQEETVVKEEEIAGEGGKCCDEEIQIEESSEIPSTTENIKRRISHGEKKKRDGKRKGRQNDGGEKEIRVKEDMQREDEQRGIRQRDDGQRDKELKIEDKQKAIKEILQQEHIESSQLERVIVQNDSEQKPDISKYQTINELYPKRNRRRFQTPKGMVSNSCECIRLDQYPCKNTLRESTL